VTQFIPSALFTDVRKLSPLPFIGLTNIKSPSSLSDFPLLIVSQYHSGSITPARRIAAAVLLQCWAGWTVE
jgi:hypothetical protein